MDKVLLVIAGTALLGLVLAGFKLYIGYGLAAVGSAGYLGFYYSMAKFVEAVNKDNLKAGNETYDFVGQYSFFTMVAWIILSMSLLILLISGRASSD